MKMILNDVDSNVKASPVLEDEVKMETTEQLAERC